MMLQTPDTSMSKVARVGSATRFWFAAPGVPSATGLLTDWPEVTFSLADGVSSSSQSASPQFAEQAVASSPDRQTLTLAGAFAGPAATLAWGDAFVWSPAAGTLPVRIASISGTEVKLVDRLPINLPTVSGTALHSALWYVDEGPGLPLADVTRGAQGDMPTRIDVVWSLRNAAGAKTLHRERGELSVVRQPFLTGLTTAALRRMYPELGGLGAVGEAGFEGAILRSHVALALRVRADVREAGCPGYTWEDDVSAAPFLAAHAAWAAAAVAESVAPERSKAYQDSGWPLYRSALASTLLDLNRSGTVQPGESPGLIGAATAAKMAPSRVPTGCQPAWWVGRAR